MTSLFNVLLQFRDSGWSDIPRSIFSFIDTGVYWMISALYGLIEDLARVQIFTPETMQEFYTKVYSLLSIVMLFKITFSVVTYILDPSKINDKQQGFGKIIVNILIMFIMLLSAPVVFNQLQNLQKAILDDNILPQFIFGSDNSNAVSNGITLGDKEICDNWTETSGEGEMKSYNGTPGIWKTHNSGDMIALMVLRPFVQLGDPKIENDSNELGAGTDNLGKLDTLSVFCGPSQGYDMTTSILLRHVFTYIDADGWNNNNWYVIEYRIVVSTAVGVYVALMFISLAFDVAVRSIKLSFLELIAPVPIISYIDPKSGKSGMFSKWIKEIGKTWASLFVRLFSIFLSVYIISKIDDDMINNSFADGEMKSSKFWIMLFLVIGALMFAKQLPKLLEELIPGMKLGKMQLNPFKKIEEEALGGKALVKAPGKIAAAGTGLALAAGSNIYANSKKRKLIDKTTADENAKVSAETEKIQKLRNNRQQARANYDAAQNRYQREKNQVDQISGMIHVREARGEVITDDMKAKLASAEHAAEIAKRNETLQKNNLEDAKSKVAAERPIFAETRKDASEAIAKVKKENETRSYQHPISSTLMQAFRGAKVGFDSQTSGNMIKAITNGITAAEKAANTKNDYDKFGLQDRLKDLATNLTGVKNESGTTSLVKAEIKKQNENLNDIRNGIAALEHTIGNLPPGQISYDSAGQMSISSNYNFEDGQREAVQTLIDNYTNLRQGEKTATKNVKEYQDVLDIKGKHEKK